MHPLQVELFVSPAPPAPPAREGNSNLTWGGIQREVYERVRGTQRKRERVCVEEGKGKKQGLGWDRWSDSMTSEIPRNYKLG